ncbi:hypothetical protein ETH_00022420 [Eimeria tenella]|uniref:Uncharacterized protein n=1 Tax=Eimeria tenella TaxID=5802 RepID=U6L286_EIMTE|nr:hypothetical protein ETH_00022420 [Eimeria tenella]CDJ41880.1 hypothetical protein ETH_00022420 [Eimeria tenella]|eukprot:XP_013232630.1 hypothetical protein ETH_00022420 [Eimeria tenella]
MARNGLSVLFTERTQMITLDAKKYGSALCHRFADGWDRPIGPVPCISVPRRRFSRRKCASCLLKRSEGVKGSLSPQPTAPHTSCIILLSFPQRVPKALAVILSFALRGIRSASDPLAALRSSLSSLLLREGAVFFRETCKLADAIQFAPLPSTLSGLSTPV